MKSDERELFNEQTLELLASDSYLKWLCKDMTLTEIVNFSAALLDAFEIAKSEKEKRVLDHAWKMVYMEGLAVRDKMTDDECLDWLKSSF